MYCNMHSLFCHWFVTFSFAGWHADVMVGMGYTREEIQESLSKMKYDDITATYLLLGRKLNEVRTCTTKAISFLVNVHTLCISPQKSMHIHSAGVRESMKSRDFIFRFCFCFFCRRGMTPVPAAISLWWKTGLLVRWMASHQLTRRSREVSRPIKKLDATVTKVAFIRTVLIHLKSYSNSLS